MIVVVVVVAVVLVLVVASFVVVSCSANRSIAFKSLVVVVAVDFYQICQC